MISKANEKQISKEYFFPGKYVVLASADVGIKDLASPGVASQLFIELTGNE